VATVPDGVYEVLGTEGRDGAAERCRWERDAEGDGSDEEERAHARTEQRATAAEAREQRAAAAVAVAEAEAAARHMNTLNCIIPLQVLLIQPKVRVV